MQISSATRALSSAALVSAFVFAPIGNFIGTTTFILPQVKVADAAVVTNGMITGSVLSHNYTTNADSPLLGATIELRLDSNDVVQSMTSTNASGTYAFTVPESSYRVCVVAPTGYTLNKAQASCQTVDWQSNGTAAVDNFVLTSLPIITLVDGTSTQVVLGGNYTSSGNYAVKDGNTFAQGIVPFGTVDTKTLGDYKLVYTALHKDSGLLAAVTQVVSVVTPAQYIAKPHAPGIFVEGVSVAPASAPVVSTPVQVSSAPASCKLINTYMSRDSVNEKLEVLKLQTFLFSYEGLTSVRATGVYDAATERGVRIFQDRHYKEVMSLWGIEGNTGNVYMTTSKKINEVYCGHEFPLALSQLKEIAVYRLAHLNAQSSQIAAVPVANIAATTEAPKQGGLAAWWNRAKQSLIAAFPAFGKKNSKDTITASGSVAAQSDSVEPSVKGKTGNVATAFYHFRSFLNMTVLAAIFALVLGVFAFAVSIYLYRRTRGEEELVEVVKTEEVPKNAVKIK